MKSSRWLFWLLLIFVILLLSTRPTGAWKEAKRMWAQRELMLRVLVIVVGIYFLYGLYSMYQRGIWFW